MTELDELDRRIVGALQVDGRASWRKVAKVLDESFSTVTRRGNALLESGVVRVAALLNVGKTVVVHMECEPTHLPSIARRLADDPDVVFLLVLAAPASLVFEVAQLPGRWERLLMEDAPTWGGVRTLSVSPALQYQRTLGHWRPGLITVEQAQQLRPDGFTAPGILADDRTVEETQISELLVQDGRMTSADIAARLDMNEPRVRRVVNDMLGRGVIDIRALVDPADVGLPLETWMSVDADPRHVASVAAAVADDPHVRYQATVAGPHPLLVHAAFARDADLEAFLAADHWGDAPVRVATSVVVSGPKRGGVRMRPLP